MHSSTIKNDDTACLAQRHPLLRLWQILRAVLSGYCAGQPVNEERPRKVCC